MWKAGDEFQIKHYPVETGGCEEFQEFCKRHFKAQTVLKVLADFGHVVFVESGGDEWSEWELKYSDIQIPITQLEND